MSDEQQPSGAAGQQQASPAEQPAEQDERDQPISRALLLERLACGNRQLDAWTKLFCEKGRDFFDVNGTKCYRTIVYDVLVGLSRGALTPAQVRAALAGTEVVERAERYDLKPLPPERVEEMRVFSRPIRQVDGTMMHCRNRRMIVCVRETGDRVFVKVTDPALYRPFYHDGRPVMIKARYHGSPRYWEALTVPPRATSAWSVRLV